MLFNHSYIVTIGYKSIVVTDFDKKIIVETNDGIVREVRNQNDGFELYMPWDELPKNAVYKEISLLGNPRLLFGEYSLLQALIKKIVFRNSNKLFLIKPIGYIEIDREFDGGLSELEIRGLTDVLYNSGFRKIIIKRYGKFERQEILNKKFNSNEYIIT